MERSTLYFAAAVTLFLGLSSGCATQRKLQEVQTQKMEARLQLPPEKAGESSFRTFDTSKIVRRDTLKVTDMDGKEVLIMKAVKDDETGEMIATEQIDAAVVTARFRNVAERHGKIDLEFQVIVPKKMQDSKWQLRFYPDMFILEDSVRLDQINITGKEYRAQQLRGYEQYNRFLARIVNDPDHFIDLKNFEIFIERNIPQVYKFKNDSSYVSDEIFASCFGVTEQEAIDHYTWHFAKKMNERRRGKIAKMYAKYVKSPIVTENVHLDTIIVDINGDFVYNYKLQVATRPKLRKIDIVLSGDIWEQDMKIYNIPRSEPLTFYVSSLSAFVDNTERYMTTVIERRAEAKANWKIDFKVGKADVEEDFSDNRRNLEEIKFNFRNLLVNEVFDLDSCMISASASPEGALKMNDALAEKRAKAVADYFQKYTRHLQDSLRRDAGMTISVGEDYSEGGMRQAYTNSAIKFKSRSAGENWDFLDAIVEADTLMTDAQKEQYRGYASVKDVDVRERSMQKESWYPRLKNDIYPRLRTVQFNFVMHRRNMVKDTVHTTELDTVYMRGVQALRDRDYETAVVLLAPYNDYNTAIAYVSLDRNISAMNILQNCEKTAQVNYMLAVLYSRAGDDQNAVQCYLRSCQQEPSYVHRGNLDPEIAAIIRRYGLNKQEDDFGDLGF